MAICTYCGTELSEHASLCTACGAQLSAPTVEQLETEIPESKEGACATTVCPSTEPSSHKLKLSMLIWSIANATLSLFNLLGVVGLVFTFLAGSAESADEERNRLSIAKHCNLIASILAGVFFGALGIFYLFGFTEAILPLIVTLMEKAAGLS